MTLVRENEKKEFEIFDFLVEMIDCHIYLSLRVYWK